MKHHVIGAHGALRRAMRSKQNRYIRRPKRVDWTAVMLLLAAAMVSATLAYKWMTP